MIKTVLIANRGEIACRIARTARQLGIKSVAVYSSADEHSPHLTAADEALCIGPAAVTASYLNMDAIIKAAKQSEADAIHPGYGFLSENSQFAQLCEEHNIIFIGPSSHAISLMGNKRAAKLAVMGAEVPCIPGYEGEDQSDETLVEAAKRIGFPLMIKATAGGGGKGMRIVHKLDDFHDALSSARSEALNAFGSDELLLERYVQKPRHIEIQVFADQMGNTIHLGERDCSIQRRHQKVIEESPSPAISIETRESMGIAAVNAARVCQYVGAGTVEFIMDENEQFFFLEMNTRLQVEHPVTELVTGIDLVAWQFMVAAGEPLPLKQAEVQWRGHAIEARLYAEDPRQQFLPQTGTIRRLSLPSAGRIDHAIATNLEVTPYYDPMLGKWIAWGEDRFQAIHNLQQLLLQTQLFGVNNNKAFILSILKEQAFINGNFSTHFIDENPHLHASTTITDSTALLFAAMRLILNDITDGDFNSGQFQRSSAMRREILLTLSVNEIDYAMRAHCGEQPTQLCWTISYNREEQEVSETFATEFVQFDHQNEQLTMIINGIRTSETVTLSGHQIYLDTQRGAGAGHIIIEDTTYPDLDASQMNSGDLSGAVMAPMDGKIVAVHIEPGQEVDEGETLMIMEAMKMEHPIKAPQAGKVVTVEVTQMQQAKRRQTLATLTA